MGGLLKRSVKLHSILPLQNGPAAAILPSDVTKIHLHFSRWLNDGNYGPRKFWRQCLPQLKYHNPRVPMIVNRYVEKGGPAIMTIYFRRQDAVGEAAAETRSQRKRHIDIASSSMNMSKAPGPEPHERVAVIDMNNRHSEEILELFLGETNAKKLAPSHAHTEAMAKLDKDAQALRLVQENSARVKKLNAQAETSEAKARALATGSAA